MKKFLLTFWAFSLVQITNAISPVMNRFVASFQTLQPYMVSEERFVNPQNSTLILRELESLATSSKELKHDVAFSSPFLKVVADTLPKHLVDVHATFQKDQKKFARLMLNATLDGCSSCHSQLNNPSLGIWKFAPKELSGSAFEKAEFLYAVRQYDDALPLYREVIDSYRPAKSGIFSPDVEDSLYRIVSILVRSKGDLIQAQKELEKDIQQYPFPGFILRDLRESLNAVIELQKIKTPDPKKSKALEVEKYAALTLARLSQPSLGRRQNWVAPLYVSRFLYQYAQSRPPKELTPGIFYWLAKCEKAITKNYFFPVAEAYLKECIVKYPLSIDAKLCFNELEEMMRSDYSGSMGTEIPLEDQTELDGYKKVLKAKQAQP